MNNRNTVIIDIGSYQCKAQIANKDFSRCCVPSFVKQAKKGSYECTRFIQKIYSIKYPLKNGFVVDMNAIEKIWDQILNNELQVVPSEYSVLLAIAQVQPNWFKKKAAQIFFESYEVPSLYLTSAAKLQLYDRGKLTGILVDSGCGITQSTPIFDGYSLPHTISRNQISGNAITEYLVKILMESGISFNSYSELNIANKIKEQYCYVADNYEKEIYKYNYSGQNYIGHELPDGNVITIKDQRFRCSEILFCPQLIGMDQPGIHELITQSIKKSDIDLRKQLSQNIIITGGTTLIQGFNNRLIQEVTKINPFSLKPKIDVDSDRIYSVLDGAKLLLNLSEFQSMWISKSLYYEYGPDILERNCWG